MKKNIFLIILAFIFSINNGAYSITTPELNKNFQRKIEERQIKSTLKKHNKMLDSNKINLINSFYDDNYKSADGFDLEEMKNMFEATRNSFSQIKHNTKINNINAYQNWALVQMSDYMSAKMYISKQKKYKNKVGKIEGRSSFLVYLKKENDDWKIIKDEILMEETSLKFGVAKKIDMDLVTPISIKNNEEYNLSLDVKLPKDIVAIASLTREEISHTPKAHSENFRKIPEESSLERIVKANNNNKDEFAAASIGFTKVSLNKEETKARIEILGMAYLMKRINMDNNKE